MSRGRWGFIGAAYMTACLLLGGASAAGAAVNAILQLAALGLIVATLWSGIAVPREGRVPLLIGLLFLAVGLLTLVPLPPSVWTGLPFREFVAAGFRLIGMDLPPLPVSLAPRATAASLLWLLPPTAMYLLVLKMNNEERRILPWSVLIVAGLSIVLGAFQLLGGRDSPLRFYEITNTTASVGFFANRNHEATLLLCALPLTAVLASRLGRQASRSKSSAGAVMSLAIALFLTAGIAIASSAAGYALFFPAALASMLVYRRAVVGRLGWTWPAALAVLMLIFIGMGVSGPLSTEKLSTEANQQDPASRRVIAETTVEVIKDTFPVGTGLGTFSTVYRLYENPNRVSQGYANHAHNDYLEVVLEAGLAGVLLVLGFLLWWVRTAFRVWRSDFPGAALARAGSAIIAVVVFHSLVDYPIRTSAIAALFAAACAFMVPALAGRDEGAPSRRAKGETLRHLEAD